MILFFLIIFGIFHNQNESWRWCSLPVPNISPLLYRFADTCFQFAGGLCNSIFWLVVCTWVSQFAAIKWFKLPLFLFMCQLSFVALLFSLGPCVLFSVAMNWRDQWSNCNSRILYPDTCRICFYVRRVYFTSALCSLILENAHNPLMVSLRLNA